MKEIVAIIRMNKINATKEALLREGFSSFHCSKVMGRGKKKIDISFIEALKRPEDIIAEGFPREILENFRLFPKRMLTMLVKDVEKDKAVKCIIDANITGNAGDGKIFILEAPEIIKIRTGERDEAAL
jgi:nitrogen regulatory protein PII 2